MEMKSAHAANNSFLAESPSVYSHQYMSGSMGGLVVARTLRVGLLVGSLYVQYVSFCVAGRAFLARKRQREGSPY